MIVKKETNTQIIVLINDTDTHARKLIYSHETDKSGRYTLEDESDLNFFVDAALEGKTAAEAGLENKLLHGYVEITENDFLTHFEQM